MLPIYSSPHTHQVTSVAQVMRTVLFAAVPGIFVMCWMFGWGTLIQVFIAGCAALCFEALLLRWRGRPIKPFIRDNSALVSALLLALAIPPLLPWWMTVLGVFFAIVIAKHLYGGLGHNPFNPAMIAYVVLLISFPTDMTLLWVSPRVVGDVVPVSHQLSFALEAIFSVGFVLPDSWAGATPLDFLKTGLTTGESVQGVMSSSSLFNAFAGVGWVWVNVAFLFGGLYLLYRRVISWQIPVGFLFMLTLCSFVFYFWSPETYATPWFHLFSGGTMLGAFFIATDPVSAATTQRGRLFFGMGIGMLVFIIRVWGAYPDAIAFAVLLMNMVAPALDHVSRTVTYGRTS